MRLLKLTDEEYEIGHVILVTAKAPGDLTIGQCHAAVLAYESAEHVDEDGNAIVDDDDEEATK